MVVVVVYISYHNARPPTPYGISSNLTASPINSCGQDGKSPCIISASSVNAAIATCNTLPYCNAFVYNPINNTMSISNGNPRSQSATTFIVTKFYT